MERAVYAVMHEALTYFGPEHVFALLVLIAGATLLLMVWPFSSRGTKE